MTIEKHMHDRTSGSSYFITLKPVTGSCQLHETRQIDLLTEILIIRGKAALFRSHFRMSLIIT